MEYDFVLVLATDSRCHLAVARNAIRIHHHHVIFYSTHEQVTFSRRAQLQISVILGD